VRVIGLGIGTESVTLNFDRDARSGGQHLTQNEGQYSRNFRPTNDFEILMLAIGQVLPCPTNDNISLSKDNLPVDI